MGSPILDNENSLHSAGMLILFKSFLGILPVNPPFFHHLVPRVSRCLSKHLTHWKFQSIAFEPKILWKNMIYQAFHEHFFYCYAIFTWIWTYKTHDLTDHQFTVGCFLQAITFMWSDRQIPEWAQFLQQQVIPSVPSQGLPGKFQVCYYFPKFWPQFCALIWQNQSPNTICFCCASCRWNFFPPAFSHYSPTPQTFLHLFCPLLFRACFTQHIYTPLCTI